MKKTNFAIGLVIMGSLLASCSPKVETDPHADLDNALKAFEYASQLERSISNRDYTKAAKSLENIAGIYSEGMFSFGTGNFSGKDKDEKALIATEDLFKTIRVLRLKIRQMETKRLNNQQKAQLLATIEQLLDAPQTIALAHYDKKSDFYMEPPRARLQATRNKLRSLSYRSPDQTKYAAKQMISSITKILRG